MLLLKQVCGRSLRESACKATELTDLAFRRRRSKASYKVTNRLHDYRSEKLEYCKKTDHMMMRPTAFVQVAGFCLRCLFDQRELVNISGPEFHRYYSSTIIIYRSDHTSFPAGNPG